MAEMPQRNRSSLLQPGELHQRWKHHVPGELSVAADYSGLCARNARAQQMEGADAEHGEASQICMRHLLQGGETCL